MTRPATRPVTRPVVRGVHLAGVPARARAHAGPLLLALLVVTLTAFLAVVTPRLVGRTADRTVQAAVQDAGPAADLLVREFLSDPSAVQVELDTTTAARVAERATALRDLAGSELPAGVLGEPVATVTASVLEVAVPGGPDALMPLVHVWREGAPGVRWLQGGPPAATGTARQVSSSPQTGPWPVQVALSEDVAAALGVRTGDRLAVHAADGVLENASDADPALQVVVSGVFEAEDPQDRVWSGATGLLAPRVSGAGVTERTEVAALLSAESLPVARLLDTSTTATTSYAFAARASALEARAAGRVGRRVAQLEADPTELADPSGLPEARSRLDDVLLDTERRVGSAAAQASVLLAGVVAAAVAALVVVADLLTRRRARELATSWARGASLAGTGAELVLEAAVVTALGATIALGLAGLLVPGPTSQGWLLPVLAVGALAAPILGVRAAARATGGRRAPADRSERHRTARDTALRRLALEGAVVLAAVGALVAVRSRGAAGADEGAAQDAGAGGLDVLVAAAPALGALVGALLLLRLLRPLARWVLARATGSRRVVPVLAAARAHASAGAGPPLVAVVLATSLAALAAALAATTSAGQVEGSWAAVGADVTVTTEPRADLPAAAGAVAARDGVRAAVAARVDDDAQITERSAGGRVRLVVTDPAAFGRLLAATPLPDAPDLARLAGGTGGAGGAGGAVPALFSSDLLDELGASTTLVRGEGPVDLRAVGTVPALGSSAESTVVVDAVALSGALGAPVLPDVLWVAGPGAAQAVAAEPALRGTSVVERTDWLAERRAQPLTAGLGHLAAASAGVLVLLAVLVVVVGAAATAPGRATALAALRTLGVDGAQARRIALGELLPPVLLASAVGVGLGALLARAVTGPLQLRLLTGQPEAPDLVLPWWTAAPAAAVVLAVVVVVVVESSVRRRERLGQVLRVGLQ
ncbi:FtsX-like permease family protein [Quadrisphaera sp. DSM 44207]|uniref:FtsX-like permease family protein n=1 Tax=Quadrisphaera sp. DSM 44207 TaxID=1881057 RepID=UPI00088B7A96|nr:FtsX-like permease family protein [Quadrisphaera sp. DSM 44207]SDQ70456.1 putative ABC transport system permease protein [Quadrisphaera sp. DSM 44207]